LKMITKMLPRA